MESQPGVPDSAVAQRTDRLRRSIAQSQLLTSAAMLLLAGTAFVITPESLSRPLFFGGLALVFVLTIVAVLVPWTPRLARFAVILPILDIVAIVAVREGELLLGGGLLLVFPVIWMARHNGAGGTALAVTLSTVCLWGAALMRVTPLETRDFPGLVILPITLAFIGVTTTLTARRTVSQRALLQQQAALAEGGFARARRQEQLLDEILNSVKFGVIAFDAEGRLTLMNESHRRALAEFGAPRDAIVHEVVYEADRLTPFAQESRPLSRALAGESFDDVTIWIGEPGARRAAYAVTSRPLTSVSGDYGGQVIVLRDVTAELDAVQARDDLVASVSHELRTPITSMLGYLELALEDDSLEEGVKKMIDIAYRNSERLQTLVSDLEHTASDDGSLLTMTFEPYDVSYTIEEAIEGQRLAIDGQGLRLETRLSAEAMTVADPIRFRQVLDNLLTNATKYNREGGAVRVESENDGSIITVRVSDTGVGISEVDQVRLFERFYRTESARQSSVHGSGIGLSIVRDIMVQHGGDLTVHSKPGVGSTFTVTLPALKTTASLVTKESEVAR